MIIMTMMLVSCGQLNKKDEKATSRYNVYYLLQDDTALGCVKTDIVSGNSTEEVKGLLSALQTQPDDVNMKAVLGNGVTLLDYSLANGIMTFNFDSDYYEMSTTSEVLFRASAVKTVTQIKDIRCVAFQVNGEPLNDSKDQPVGIMTANTFIDNTGDEMSSYSKTTLKLYFADRKGKNLIPVKEDVVYSSNISMEKLVVEKIIEGPEDNDYYPTISPDTKILSVAVRDGTCYLNLDSAVSEKPYDVTEEVELYSIVNSLAELHDVNKVQISVNGSTDKVLREKISLAGFYERNLDIVTDESGEEGK